MDKPVIQAKKLGKDYLISHEGDGASYRTLRDMISSWFQNNSKTRNPKSEIFSALNDVSFEVKEGEVLGIIGRNGAGKSTLLKVLSRITEPTRGSVRLCGRVASLLEVGTGFHPELTGRENIFLNGAILGMTRSEIRKKFDEIVDFSGVEKFLDTPVKRYSSGMYVRLAFAVAAHLDPEILIIDEVLAVGDQEFQKKCLGKIQEASRGQGRTVLFVSHNLAAIRQLCSRVLVVHQGRVVYDGETATATAFYSQQAQGRSREQGYRHVAGDGRARITRVEARSSGTGNAVVSIFEPTEIQIHYQTFGETGPVEGFVLLYAEDGECVAASFQRDSGPLRSSGSPGRLGVHFVNPLAPGRYLVSAGLFDESRQFLDWVEFAETLEVNEGFADGRAYDHRLGRSTLTARWEQ